MDINILHLYYNLMNLYGDSGNIKAIIYSLAKQNVNTIVDWLSIEDDIDFSKYDLIYIGSGTERNQLIARDNILKYKDKYFIEKLIKSIDENYIINEIDLELNEKAYENYIKTYYKHDVTA